jgi:hypothetical protein
MRTKDPMAAELGRRGGIKGGKARSLSLSPERRRDIARRAAAARWGAKSADGVAESGKPNLSWVATAVRRATMQLGDRTFEVFALADGRQLLGLLSVQAALAREGSIVPGAVDSEAAVVSFKEDGSWQVLKGMAPADFLALCCHVAHDALAREAADPELLEHVLSILLDCASDGLKHRLELALKPG